MADPRDEDLDREAADEGEQDELEGDEAIEARAEPERDERGRRLALSDEIARRWDPRRLVRQVVKDGGRGEPLDVTTRGHFERKLGVDLGDVRLYSGSFAEQVTRQHQAEAVTVGGTGMIFMSGTPERSSATSAGRALLAHELTHVAQASRGLYRSAPGQSAPLATAEHEAEAEQAEAEELNSSPPSPAGEELNMEEFHELILSKVSSRVMEMMYEDERVDSMRNGKRRYRP